MPRWPAWRLSSIHAAIAFSHGQRSSSVSGVPLCIFSTFDFGWNSSPSRYSQPSSRDSNSAIVVLPQPDTPMMTRTAKRSAFGFDMTTEFLAHRGEQFVGEAVVLARPEARI